MKLYEIVEALNGKTYRGGIAAPYEIVKEWKKSNSETCDSIFVIHEANKDAIPYCAFDMVLDLLHYAL